MPITLQNEEKAALERLIAVAKRDTGQSARVADFLLAWWNAGECGGFDLTSAWGLDTTLAADVITVFGFVVRASTYPDTLGYKADFETIIRGWRRGLLESAQAG